MRTTHTVAIDDETRKTLEALHRALGKSRRRIVAEAVAGYAVLLDLNETARPRKEIRPCPSESFCSSARSSSRSSRRSRPSSSSSGGTNETLRAERDEARESYCLLMEAYRGGDGKVTANKLGWGYLFAEDSK